MASNNPLVAEFSVVRQFLLRDLRVDAYILLVLVVAPKVRSHLANAGASRHRTKH
jgi:hypothetical protein